jgi:hypothetical protein
MPPIIDFGRPCDGVTSSPWCDQCRLPTVGCADIAQHWTPACASLRHRPTCRQSAGSTAPQTLIIPTESLPQGDLARYLACPASPVAMDPQLFAMYRRAGQSCRNAIDQRVVKSVEMHDKCGLIECVVLLHFNFRPPPSSICDNSFLQHQRPSTGQLHHCVPSDSCRSRSPQLDVEELRYPLIGPWSRLRHTIVQQTRLPTAGPPRCDLLYYQQCSSSSQPSHHRV